MVKRGSSQLRYTLINCCLPLIRFDMTFATYYAKKRGEGKPHRVSLLMWPKSLLESSTHWRGKISTLMHRNFVNLVD